MRKEKHMTQLEKDVDRIGRAGQAAWKRLQKCKSWTDWMAVGEALVAGRAMAMQGAKTNRPEGKGYNQLFSQYLTHYGLAEIDKSARAKLLRVMEHRGEIEDYRNALPQNLRLELNHPVTVLRRWQAATKVSKPRAPRHDYAGEIDGLAAHVAELEAAREPMTLCAAREQYVAHLLRLDADARRAELESLQTEIGLVRYA
jgi:hypothetical protein